MKNKSLLITFAILIFAMSSEAQVNGTYTDTRDGKTYKTVKIGKQIWMAENLAYKANTGCWAYNNDTNNVSTLGYLYNWETAKNVCPSGWHLPSDAEWTILTVYSGDFGAAGSKLKEAGTTHWRAPNTGATNESVFTALPGGERTNEGKFDFIGGYSYWWSSTKADQATAIYYCLKYNGSGVVATNDDKRSGYSVRCVKDK